jgi:hypothetical protein
MRYAVAVLCPPLALLLGGAPRQAIRNMVVVFWATAVGSASPFLFMLFSAVAAFHACAFVYRANVEAEDQARMDGIDLGSLARSQTARDPANL